MMIELIGFVIGFWIGWFIGLLVIWWEEKRDTKKFLKWLEEDEKKFQAELESMGGIVDDEYRRKLKEVCDD